MAYTSRFQHLVAFLVFLAWTVEVSCDDDEVKISPIFNVQTDGGAGSCNGHDAALDQCLEECSFSLDTALNAIDNSLDNESVQNALGTFFRIDLSMKTATSLIKTIRIDKLTHKTTGSSSTFFIFSESSNVRGLFNKVPGSSGGTKYKKDDFWLHCDSTFLVEHQRTDPAWDVGGQVIHNDKNEIVAIQDVEAYKEPLKDKKNRMWVPDHVAGLNGYYFDPDGGGFCAGGPKRWGLTANIQRVKKDDSGKYVEPKGEQLASVIICPASFTRSDAPDNYRDASNALSVGKSIHEVVPKSATLLHEAFHAVLGDVMAAGKQEFYDIAEVVDLGATAGRKNIENYVFFITHMYLRFGEPNKENPQDPSAIPTQWDFEVSGESPNKHYGAKTPQ